MPATQPRKLTARQLLRQFPDLPFREGCLEDIACPQCGQRESFNIQITTLGEVNDDGSECDCGDHEWEDTSYCRCADAACRHAGKVRDFTFKGLDALIATCACTEHGWHGPGHTAGCPLARL